MNDSLFFSRFFAWNFEVRDKNSSLEEGFAWNNFCKKPTIWTTNKLSPCFGKFSFSIYSPKYFQLIRLQGWLINSFLQIIDWSFSLLAQWYTYRMKELLFSSHCYLNPTVWPTLLQLFLLTGNISYPKNIYHRSFLFFFIEVNLVFTSFNWLWINASILYSCLDKILDKLTSQFESIKTSVFHMYLLHVVCNFVHGSVINQVGFFLQKSVWNVGGKTSYGSSNSLIIIWKFCVAKFYFTFKWREKQIRFEHAFFFVEIWVEHW